MNNGRWGLVDECKVQMDEGKIKVYQQTSMNDLMFLTQVAQTLQHSHCHLSQ